MQICIDHVREPIAAHNDAVVQPIRRADRLRPRCTDSRHGKTVAHEKIPDVFRILDLRKNYDNIRHIPTSLCVLPIRRQLYPIQILLQLPRGHRCAVGLPFCFLGSHKFRADLTQCLEDQFILL